MSAIPFEAPSIESIAALFPAFEFDHLIAQGGMGAVYKARQRSLDRDVAIKILPRELGDDPLFRTSFEAEAKAMARVIHPNLIAVYDSGDVGGLLYIVMEYVPGKSLHYSAHGKAIEPKQAVEIVLGICRGLEEAHENGIVHRDIKPANILLTPKREPKIGDFGLARAAGHDSEGLVMGTPGYTAPEVTDQPEMADQGSDLFSVGVILLELLTGRPPQDGLDPFEGVNDPGLLKIGRKATDPDHTTRYQDATAMVHDLRSWLSPSKPVPTATPTSTRAMIDPTANSTLGRNIAIIIVLLIAIFVTWNLLQKKKEVRAAQIKNSTPAKVIGQDPKEENPPSGVTSDPIRKTTPPISTPPPVVKEVPAETPAESLVRLREDLAAGDFNELPVGTLSKQGSLYFFVSKAMSWADASRMARAYGGHLPIVKDEAFRTWMAEALPSGSTEGSSVWLGATRTSPERWQWVSALPWQLDTLPKGSGDLAALNPDGSVIAEEASGSHPFFIQWHRDGSDPTEITEILSLSKKSLETDDPFYPPGVKTLGERHFLIVEEPVSYTRAHQLAHLGGGELMTAATEEEADWLEKQVKGIQAPDGLWLGATLKDDLWGWNSLQPWTFARWSGASQAGAGDALLIKPGSGWAAADRESQASGFIIEWSDDRQETAPPTQTDELDELVAKAKFALQGYDGERGKKGAKNAKDYIFKLEVWLRDRGKNSLIAAWTPRVQAVIAAVKNGRLPADIPKKPNAVYPEPLLEIAHFHLSKQRAIDLKFTNDAETLRNAYVDRLREAADQAKSLGQREKALKFSEDIDAAADIDAWLGTFGFTSD